MCAAILFRPFRGSAKKRTGFLGPRPLAWAVLVRPFGAHFGISSARTPGVQQKMWDMIRGRREAPHKR